MKKKNVCRFMLLFASILLIFVDQITKQMALEKLQNKADVEIIKGVLDLHFLKNTGAAWGILPNATWFFSLITIIICIAIIYVIIKIPFEKKYYVLMGILVTIMSGAIGNLIDRITRKYVVDFIYFKIINFPVFNVADIYVSVCGIILAILVIFYYKEEDFAFLGGKMGNNGK